MKRILITGKNGQVGYELQRSLSPLAEVIAVGHLDCDFANESALRDLIQTLRPDIIVNAAAYTAVDKAESEPELANAINHLAPRVLAEEAKKLNSLIIHYSTDYVFDGNNQSPYFEKDTTNPQSVYGRTKLDGENAIAKIHAKHLIFRTSWVLGAYGNNFIKTILRLAGEKDQLKVVVDQHGAPTSAALLADVTAHIIARATRDGINTLPFGLYHLSASGRTNWHEYACMVVKAGHCYGKSLKLSAENINAITTSEYPTPAKRPYNSSLNTDKFQSAFGLVLPDWKVGVGHVLTQVLS